MTVGHIQDVLDGYPGGGTKKLVLIGIANHDGDGGSWPKIDTLARYAGVSRRNVQKAIEQLAADGWLTVQVQAGGTRNTRADQRSNLYEVDYERLRDGVSLPTPRGVSLATQRGVAGDTRTIHNRPSNRNDNPSAPPAKADGQGALAGIQAPKATGTTSTRQARAIIRAVWDARNPRPAAPFVALVKIAQRLLDAGHTAKAVEAAFMAAPAFTIAALEFQLNGGRANGRNGRSVKDADTSLDPYAAALDGPTPRTTT